MNSRHTLCMAEGAGCSSTARCCPARPRPAGSVCASQPGRATAGNTPAADCWHSPPPSPPGQQPLAHQVLHVGAANRHSTSKGRRWRRGVYRSIASLTHTMPPARDQHTHATRGASHARRTSRRSRDELRHSQHAPVRARPTKQPTGIPSIDPNRSVAFPLPRRF